MSPKSFRGLWEGLIELRGTPLLNVGRMQPSDGLCGRLPAHVAVSGVHAGYRDGDNADADRLLPSAADVR